MKKFFSITLCVMLIFATVCCLTACENEDIMPVYIRINDPTGERKYVYSGDRITLPYTGEEYVLEVEIVTIKGKIVMEGEPTVIVKTWPGLSEEPLKQIGNYHVNITYNTPEEHRNYARYSSAYFFIKMQIEAN